MDINLNKIVIFRQNTPSQKGAGRQDSYANLVTTRGQLKKKSSSRGLQAGETTFSNSYELIVRFQDAIYNAIRSDLKVLIDSVTYTISGWEKLEEKRFYLKFELSRQDG